MSEPHTIAGLQRKPADLVELRRQLEADLLNLTADIDHLDAALRLFDPQNVPAAIRRSTTKHRAKKGHVTRFVLERLRATAPDLTTARDLTLAWLEARSLRIDDATFGMIRKRTGACLIKLVAQGMVEAVDTRSLWRGDALRDVCAAGTRRAAPKAARSCGSLSFGLSRHPGRNHSQSVSQPTLPECM